MQQQQVNHQEQEQTYGGQSFQPRDWNAREQEPEAAEGEYTATIRNAKFKVSAPEKGSDPQIGLSFKIDACANDDDEAAQKSVGGTVFDTITFFAPGSRNRVSNMHKRRWLDLLRECGLDSEIVPRSIQTAADFDEALAALKDKQITIRVTHSPRTNDQGEPNGVFVNLEYGSLEMRGEVEEAVEEEKPAPRQAARKPQTTSKAKPSANAKSNKTSRR